MRTPLRLRVPGLYGVHEKSVNAAEPQPPEHATRKRPAALASDQHVRASGALGEREIAMLFHDKLAPQRNHEQHAEPPAQQRQRKNPPESKFRAKPQNDQRRNRENH